MSDPRHVPCDDCEGSGHRHHAEPLWDDPYYVHIQYGVPCPACDGDGYIEIEDEDVTLDDLEEENSL